VSVLRFDHVGTVVENLDAVVAFFVALGFERDDGGLVEGEWVDKIVGLEGVRADVVFMRTPDGSGKLELIKFYAPADTGGADSLPANRLGFRHICVEVEDLGAIVNGLRVKGYDTVGEVRDYEDVYRLCYVRGPEGLIIELAQRLAAEGVR
jgi:catechol 2,3-dioxygenase-like lactoylglutathione lyase family enzyme